MITKNQNIIDGKNLTAADAVMSIAMAAAASDGKLEESEISRIRMLVFESPLFENVENAEEYIISVGNYISNKNQSEIIENAKKILSPSLRETAFAWAVYLVHADKKLMQKEHKFLHDLKEGFEINGHLAGKISAVISMLTRTK